MNGLIHSSNDLRFINVDALQSAELQSVVKRITDIALSMLALFILSPAMLLIAIGVKYSSPGSILFKQRRNGLDGKEFYVYKFRSMTVMEDGEVVVQARKGDRRVTSFGAFLRRTSLDELPQFLNVLQGHMSIVGPRPHAVAHNEMYSREIENYRLRHRVKPGITGLAQVNGCREETATLDKMRDRLGYDLKYLETWSLGLDFRIMVGTLFAVFDNQDVY